ncbi:MAG TPA: alkaline phosphatase family protein, partial [Acidimicrobiales bacterium]
ALPDYAGGCIANIVPALFETGRPAPWLPEPVRSAEQVVLLVLDGIGWLQLQEHAGRAPALCAMAGGPITSVAPTTTSAALTSITVGAPPAAHGVLGYRVHVGGGAVLNVLQWRTAEGDARESVPPAAFQTMSAFGGKDVPVVTRAEFAKGGFTTAALGTSTIAGWTTPATIGVEVARLLGEGAPLVYGYYDGIDKVAHAHGLGEHFDAELAFADRLVADLAAALPRGAALLVTADHGQVEVGDRLVPLHEDVLAATSFLSGEGRFRWLHARDGRAGELAERARRYEDEGVAWVRTRDEAIADGWFGGEPAPDTAARLGDVVVAAAAPIAFPDAAEPGGTLVCRHGSLTPEEMTVPLLAVSS